MVPLVYISMQLFASLPWLILWYPWMQADMRYHRYIVGMSYCRHRYRIHVCRYIISVISWVPAIMRASKTRCFFAGSSTGNAANKSTSDFCFKSDWIPLRLGDVNLSTSSVVTRFRAAYFPCPELILHQKKWRTESLCFCLRWWGNSDEDGRVKLWEMDRKCMWFENHQVPCAWSRMFWVEFRYGLIYASNLAMIF